eukprot:682936-Prorocentrum_minimum.AAC.1
MRRRVTLSSHSDPSPSIPVSTFFAPPSHLLWTPCAPPTDYLFAPYRPLARTPCAPYEPPLFAPYRSLARPQRRGADVPEAPGSAFALHYD